MKKYGKLNLAQFSNLMEAKPTPQQLDRCLQYLREVIVDEALRTGEYLEYAIAKRLAQELAWREQLWRIWETL